MFIFFPLSPFVFLAFIVLPWLARRHGWPAVLCVTAAITLLAPVLWVSVFDETRILAVPLLCVSLFLVALAAFAANERDLPPKVHPYRVRLEPRLRSLPPGPPYVPRGQR